MRRRLQISVLWMAATFVLLGSAFSFAQTGSNHGSDVSAVAKPTATPPGSDHGKDVSDAAKKDESESSDESGERKHNHGFFVSQAAHCEDVSDPDTPDSETFTAPADCKDDGKAHGEYVGSVAKSSLGKPDKAHGKPE